MQTELESKKAELSALKDTAIYNATNIKQTSANTFRKRLELVVGSCLADNGKMLTDFEDVQNIQLGKKWRTFKANFEKYELDMTVFWDCVAKKYHQHDDKAENLVKDMIATAKKAEKEKAENPQAEKPTAEELQGMVIAELKKLATEKGLTVPKKAKKADIISIIENAA